MMYRKLYGVTFYGNEASDYAKENNKLDYATLAKAFDAVLSNDLMNKTADIGYWDIENGNFAYYEDSEGNTYTESERDDAIEELTEQLEELEYNDGDEAEIEVLKERIEALEDANYYEDDVFQWYIISGNGAEILKNWTDEIVMYNEELDIYLWGVTHWGTSWDYVLTDIELNCGEEAYN